MIGEFRSGDGIGPYASVAVPAIWERAWEGLSVTGAMYSFIIETFAQIPPELELKQCRQADVERSAVSVSGKHFPYHENILIRLSGNIRPG